ncbi:MAG: tetratricopeptide repeat protein, partial [Candidatus Saccharimonadales bacterium]
MTPRSFGFYDGNSHQLLRPAEGYMTSGDDSLQSLREALRLSPDNLPLRRHLAETLLGRGHAEEAEAEFRKALSAAPHDAQLKLGLARAFFSQGKDSAALVIVEALGKQRGTPAAAQVLHARLLLRAGEVERAVAQYKLALENDPAAA